MLHSAMRSSCLLKAHVRGSLHNHSMHAQVEGPWFSAGKAHLGAWCQAGQRHAGGAGGERQQGAGGAPRLLEVHIELRPGLKAGQQRRVRHHPRLCGLRHAQASTVMVPAHLPCCERAHSSTLAVHPFPGGSAALHKRELTLLKDPVGVSLRVAVPPSQPTGTAEATTSWGSVVSCGAGQHYGEETFSCTQLPGVSMPWRPA